MQGLIDIEPKQFLDFQAEEHKIAQAQLTVFNLTKSILTFKIKTTTPNLFQVKPSIGVIEPNQQATVDIFTTQLFREGAKLDSKFQINATLCETEDQGIEQQYTDLTLFWRGRDTQLIQSVQVKSRLKQVQQQPPTEEFQDVQKIEQPNQQEIVNSSTMSNDPKLYQSIMDNSKEKEEEIQKYQEQLEKLQKEYSDYQVMLNSLKQQQVAVKEHANKFDLKHVAIIVAISFILGFLFGK